MVIVNLANGKTIPGKTIVIGGRVIFFKEFSDEQDAREYIERRIERAKSLLDDDGARAKALADIERLDGYQIVER